MDVTRKTTGSPSGSRDQRSLPPFGGLGFDFCGLGRTCARLAARPQAAAPGNCPAGVARA